MKKLIGIYAGTFDPIHIGHISFALEAKVDEVYFMAEPQPRHKPTVTNAELRRKMIDLAIDPYSKLKQISLDEKYFSIDPTSKQLDQIFQGSQIVFLFGSDVFNNLPKWPDVDMLTSKYDFIISIRNQDELPIVNNTATQLGCSPTILTSQYPAVSSKKIRDALRSKHSSTDMPTEIVSFAERHNIYS